MSDYTADDFSRTNTATRGAGELARRIDPEGWLQWKYVASDGSEGWRADERMAAEGWVPVLVEPRSNILDDLAAAWETAEQSDECRKGDVLIRNDEHGGFRVYVAASDGHLMRSRILSHAPKREPWADLADVLRASLLSDETVERVAHGIHASHDRGWHFEEEDHAVQEEYRDMARAALTAAIGDDEVTDGRDR